MKYLTVVMGLILLIIMWGCARVPVYKSTWQQSLFEMNENDMDWVSKMTYNSESGIMYGLSNDQENLYVKVKFENFILQQKVMKTGLTFWIDTSGKKKKQLGLIFPVKSPYKNMQALYKSRMSGNGQNRQQQILDTALFNSKYRRGRESMNLVNYFGAGRNDMVDNKNKEGINATLWMDSENMLYYEAEISLQKIFPNPQKFLIDSTNYFSFGIETGKMEIPLRDNGGDRLQMGSRGGGGRGSGGKRGMHGSGGSQSSGNGSSNINPNQVAIMQALSVVSKVWIKKASLSNNKEILIQK